MMRRVLALILVVVMFAAPASADRYLLESSATDGYLLEDGSGVLLLEGSERNRIW
jgi:hypothetical protein